MKHTLVAISLLPILSSAAVSRSVAEPMNVIQAEALINGIENKRNSAELKYHFFLTRRVSLSDKKEVVAKLHSAFERQPRETSRWFTLGSAYAYGSFHCISVDDTIPRDQACLVYYQMFVHSKHLDRTSAPAPIVRDAIGDFVTLMAGPYGTYEFSPPGSENNLMARALTIYAALGDSSGLKYSWSQAASTCGADEVLKPIAEGIATRHPVTYFNLTLAAAVTLDSQPGFAADVLKQAAPIVPITDRHEAQRYFQARVDALLKAGRTTEAAGALRDEIARLQVGAAKLAILFDSQGNTTDFNLTFATIKAATSDDQDVIEIASYLLAKPHRESHASKMDDAAINLLEVYLRRRQRDTFSDLRARFILSHWYTQHGREEQARVLIDSAQVPKGADATAKVVYNSLIRFRAQIK